MAAVNTPVCIHRPATFGTMPLPLSGSSGRRSMLLALVLFVPALLKLFVARVDVEFETHTMAVEWLASGHFRHHYLGSWDPAFQFPVYTSVLAFIYLLGLGGKAVLLFQVLCGTATAYLTYAMAHVLLKDKRYVRSVALCTALVVGLHPFLAFYQVRMIHPFAWDTLLATALCHLALIARPGDRVSMAGLFALGGLALLNRPTLGIFLLPFALREWSFLFSLRQLPLKLACCVLLFAPLLAWMVRNHAVTGRYQLTSVTDQMVWMGLQEETQGSGQLSTGANYLELLSLPERRWLFAVGTAERSAFFNTKWKEELQADRWLRWGMLAVKLRNFWFYRTHLGMEHDARPWAIALYKVYASLLLIVLLVAAALGDAALRPLLWSALVLSVVQCSFYFETRHRLLVEPLLVLVAAATVIQFFHQWRKAPLHG